MNSFTIAPSQPGRRINRRGLLKIVLSVLVALALMTASSVIGRWWPGLAVDYSALVQKKLSIIDGVAGAVDASDEAVVRGTALLARKQPQEAVREFELAVAEQPAYPMAWLNLGVAYYQVGRTNDTLRVWLRAYAMDKYNGLIPYNLGLLHELQGQLRTAREFYQQAARVDPGNKDAVRAVDRLKILDR